MTRADVLLAAPFAGAVVALVAVVEWLHARSGAPPALLRKISHIGSGTLALLAPACFSSNAPLLAFSGLSALFYLVVGRLDVLPATRASGSAYFAIAVLILGALFWEAHGEAFTAGMAVVAFGDGLAGVVGELAGRHRYRVGRNVRSLEGSLTMFAVSLPTLAVVLLAHGGEAPGRMLAVAVGLAALATLVEAASPGGSDNLWVALVTGFATLPFTAAAPG